MQPDENTQPIPNAPALPSPGRLMIIAVLVPAAVALTNQYFFDQLARSSALQPWLYPWMAATSAVLSWSVGRYLYPAWLRWLLFAWCLLLLDFLTMATSQGDNQTGYLLVSAQVNLVTLWAILGPRGWQMRLPAVLVATATIFILVYSFHARWDGQDWAFSMYMTAIIGGMLCIGLRLLGFRLRLARSVQLDGSENAALRARQFGLRHLFLWATAIVPLLLVTRGIDLLSFLQRLDKGSVFAAAILAVSLATLNLIAIWCVLGSGWWIVRLTFLLVGPLLIAAGLTFFSSYLVALYGPWANTPHFDIFIRMHDQWYGWLWVNAALLAALLLFLRASGYLLVRRSPSSPATH